MDTTVQRSHLSVTQPPALTAQEDITDVNSDINRHEEVLGRGQHKKEASIRLRDYVTHSIRKKSLSTSSPIPRHASGTPYPIAHYVNCGNFSVRYRNFLAALAVE